MRTHNRHVPAGHVEFKDADALPTAAEFKKVAEDIGKAFEEFKKAHEEQTKKSDAVTADKLKKLDDALNASTEAKTALDKRVEAAEQYAKELEKKMGRPGAGGADGAKAELELKSFNDTRRGALAGTGSNPGADVDLEGYGHYKAGFKSFLRRGEKRMGDDEHKAMQAGTQPDGGFLIPADTSGRIVTRIFETSPIRSIASIQAISSDRLKGLKDTDQAAVGGWVSDTTAPTDTATAQVGEWEIVPAEQFAMPKATSQLLEDAAIDVEGWLAAKVADILTRTENAAFVNGNGAGQPRGLMTYPTSTTADASRAWGNIQYTPTGAAGDLTSADCLFNIIGSLKAGYLQNAQWLTRREVVTKIRLLKDSQNRYLWEPSLQKGTPQLILGYPLTIAQDMPTIAANAVSAAFGDFQQGYQIVDRLGITVLRDPFTAKPYVVFYTRKRTGGDVVQFECFRYMKFAAS